MCARCVLEPNVTEIGCLEFGRPHPITVTLRNTGTVEAK